MSAQMTDDALSQALTPQQLEALSWGHDTELWLQLRIAGHSPAQVESALQQLSAQHALLRSEVRSEAGYRLPRLCSTADVPAWRWQLAAQPDGSLDLQLWLPAVLADVATLMNLATALAEVLSGSAADEEALSYADFAAWQAGLRQDEGEGRRVWSQLLGAAAAPVQPAIARAAAPSGRSGQLCESLAVDACQALQQWAQARQLSLSDACQALWWILLSRHGDGRFAVGWRHDCRNDYEPMHGLLGRCERELPLHWQLAPEQDLDAAVAMIAAQLQSAREWQEHWPPDVEASANPPALYSFQDLQWPQLPDAVQLQQWRTPLAGAALRLVCVEQGGDERLRLQLDYDMAVWTSAAAATLLRQYGVLMHSVSRLHGPLANLPLVDEQWAAALRRRHDAEQAALPAPTASLAQRIAAWAQHTPQAVAVTGPQGALDYAGLESRVRTLAAALIGHGVRPGDRVALLLPPGPDLIVALLASWRAGAAYVPLDGSWPIARLQQLIADAAPAVLLCPGDQDGAAELAPAVPRVDPGAVAVQAPALAADLQAHAPAHVDADPAALAYLLYTSGSSGRPKGVLVEHGALDNYLRGVEALLQLPRFRRQALVSSVATDLGNTVLFGALANGATLCLPEPEALHNGARFAAFMRRHAVDCLKIVPSHLSALLEDGQAGALPAACLILGGEPSRGGLLQQIQRLAPQCRVFNHYGPTEATVGVMVHDVGAAADAESLAPEASLPLSQVLPGNRVQILDAAQQIAAVGLSGELCIGGANLARGYWQRDAEQTRSFVDDPLNPGRRLYRTGDRAFYRPDGSIALCGRLDQQLKINGHRVETGEVEAALLLLPGVREAAVVARPGSGGQPQLQAFVCGEASDVGALREALTQILPPPMRPSALRWLPSLPRLVNGKIDRQALAALPQVSEREGLAPRNPLERVLASLWCDLLGLERVGVEDDFFELGGQSLLAIRLSSRIRRALHVELAAGVVFEHRSVAALAALLHTHEGAAPRAERIVAAFDARRAGAVASA